MGNVVGLRAGEKSELSDELKLSKFREWWGRQDKRTRALIVDFVNGYDLRISKEMCEEVLAFLNLKARKSFRAVEVNLKPIRARLQSGVTMEDMKSVVAMKCREWGGDERMAAYLRPATLFSATNFEQYLGQLE